MKNFAWLAASLAFSVALAAPVRADVIPCPGRGGSTGTATCSTTRSCNDDAECFGLGLGRCVRATGSGSTSGGVCSPSCNPIFRCGSMNDCPSFDPLVATCRATSIPSVPNICEYHDSTGRLFMSLCGSGTATLGQFQQCFGTGGHWADGDCDDDGVLNGVDADPCNATDTASAPQVASPFCLGGQICEGTSSVCAPFVRCANGSTECDAVATQVGTTGWECSALPAAPAAFFCHASCNATAHCGGTISCGPLGTCRSVDATLSMCVPSALATCAPSCNPIDWASAQGDCDGDGAQNGCDSSPCTVGTAVCLYNHVCTLDAGVSVSDAGNVNAPDAFISLDAGTDAAAMQSDASQSEPDANAPDANAPDAGRTTFDGGGNAIDATSGVDAGSQGFNGGGGCRCTIVGTNVPASHGVWALLMLALVIRRRRR